MTFKTEYQDYPTPNREYRDTLFRMVFSQKEDLLALYNAINHTDYTNPEDLTVNTLSNAIYMTMKNDISFLLGCTMNLYEHQSTYNPNMPLRGILYFSRLYESFITEQKINIYSSTLQKLPTPRYIVFYNGTRQEPDRTILRLSDAFMKECGCLECEVTMLNINYGRNQELMEKCTRLKEYALFVDKIRELLPLNRNDLEAALNLAIDTCIHDNILKDILIAERAKVLGVLLTTFDKELYEDGLKKDAYSEGKSVGFTEGHTMGLAEGHAAGLTEGAQTKIKELIQKKLQKGKSAEEIAEDLEEDVETIRKILNEL